VDVSDDERAAIEQVTGALSLPVLRAVRDGRGRDFQRLEFLGDSVLDVLVSAHAVVDPQCSYCARADGNVARLVTDVTLAVRAQEIHLGSWLEWQASAERLADLAEACIAAAWLTGAWGQAIPVAERMVHPMGELTAIFTGNAVVPVSPSKASRRVGAAFLELAGAVGAFNSDPTADEAQLSAMRAAVHRAERIAQFAQRSRLVTTNGEASQVSDRVEEQIAKMLWEQGADSALTLADRALHE
jgi:dsRNA-specific ribonuclease